MVQHEDTVPRWERMCARFEDLIAEWLAQTAVPQPQIADKSLDAVKLQKEWGQLLASVSMAAQRVAGLRTILCDLGDDPEREDDDGEAIDSPERRHWQALQGEDNSDADEE